MRAEPSGSKCVQYNLPVKAAEQDSTCSCAIEAKSQKVDLTTTLMISTTDFQQQLEQQIKENERLRTRNAVLEERLRQFEELYVKMHGIMQQYSGMKGIHG